MTDLCPDITEYGQVCDFALSWDYDFVFTMCFFIILSNAESITQLFLRSEL